MNLNAIGAGKNPPEDIHVVVEISQGAVPVKYELDKDSGTLFVDRFLTTSMIYPANYGFVPCTLSDDGDPVDVLVLTQHPIQAGAVIRCRPIGVLMMEDEKGQDEKVLAVPHTKLDPFYEGIKNYTDLPASVCEKINHFFEHYKDLEKGKWVKVTGWADATKAKTMITEGVTRLAAQKAA